MPSNRPDKLRTIPNDPIDLPFMAVGELLGLQADRYGAKALLAFEDDPPLSYRDVDALVNRLANGLQEALALRRGDHVNVMLPDCPEYLITWLALSRIGCVCVCVNTDFRGVSLERVR